jgi:hypothetical protein
MVIPTDVQVSFLAAAFFADLGADVIEAAAKHSTAEGEVLYSKYRIRALAYPALFVGPSATVFLLGWPAWESQYWSARFEATTGNPFNGTLYALFLVSLFLGGWFGNWLGFRWVLSGARKRLRVLSLGILLLTIAIVWVQWPAPIRLGTYDDFHRDPSGLPYIWQDRTFFVGFWVITAYCVVPLVVWYLRIRQSVKKERPSYSMLSGSLC